MAKATPKKDLKVWLVFMQKSRSRIIVDAVIVVVIMSLLSVGAAAFPTVKHAFVLATTHQPERLTELYFPADQTLPATYTPGKSYIVAFAIHNMEYRTTTYPYKATLQWGNSTQVLKTGSVTLANSQEETIDVPVVAPASGARVEVAVSLTRLNQSIHFWLTRVNN